MKMVAGKHRDHKEESGVALLEFAVVLPFMLFVCLVGMVEVGSMLVAHQDLTSIVRETARQASKSSGLTPEITYTSSECGPLNITVSSSHAPLHRRACILMKIHKYNPTTSQVRTTFTPNSCLTAPCTGTVHIQLTAEHKSLIFGFSLFPISVERVAPHLYQDL